MKPLPTPVDRAVDTATSASVAGILADLLAAVDARWKLADQRRANRRRIDVAATLADADRQYAAMMHAHDALFGQPCEAAA